MRRTILTTSCILLSFCLSAKIVYRHNSGGGCTSRGYYIAITAEVNSLEETSFLDSDCGTINIKRSKDSRNEIIVTADLMSSSIELEYKIYDLKGNTEIKGVIKDGITSISTIELSSGIYIIAIAGCENVEYLKFNKD